MKTKEEIKKYNRDYYKKNIEKFRKKALRWYHSIDNEKKRKLWERGKMWKKNNKKAAYAIYRRDYLKNREKRNEITKKYIRRLRLSVLTHYGGDPPKCACCGESEIKFLTIDHINGRGREDHKRVGGGSGFYCWLKRNNFPEGFQVLCYNCNCTKGFYGQCPHQALDH